MAKYFICTTNKPAVSFRAGETMEFFLRAYEDGLPIACGQVQWELLGDDGQAAKGISACPKEGFTVKAACKTPGFVRLTCTALTTGGAADSGFDICISGAGADIAQIRAHDTPPADFNEYWKHLKSTVEASRPTLLEKTAYTQNVPEGFACYDVKIASPAKRPASGYLSIPKGAGPFPAILSFRGYGLKGAQPAFTEGAIHLNVNAHGIENGLTEYERIYPELQNYGFDKTENLRVETTYWQDMMLRNLSALQFLKTLPAWDKKNLTCMGKSQGALQAVTCAAHDKSVTFLDISIPWLCDLNAEACGCLPGWRPAYAPGLRYFDGVFQAQKVVCPVRIHARLGDTVCPPGTVMALYQNFKCKKSIQFIQSGTHTYLPPKPEIFTLAFDPKKPEETLLPGRYRHFKGNEYQLLAVAMHSETSEEMVMYKALYGEGGVWVRPAAMWNEPVSVAGRTMPRFSLIEPE